MDPNTVALPERYRLIGVLGSGGMSHVYRAHDSILDKTVAIKILQLESGFARDDQIRRFQMEAKATATLKHDNIVNILDFGLTDDAVPYMVLDHLDGKSLKEIIDGGGPLQLERALPVFLQVCAGLEHAHKNGIIHRDLKPSNIIFATDANGTEVVKVIDFGIARMDDNSRLTATNAVVGSPPYMSPEQASGKSIGATSDIYSLGCVIFESLTGKPPFVGNTSVETIMMQVNDAPPKLSDVADGDFPPALESLVAKLLQKDPGNRFQSIQQVIDALKGLDSRTTTGIVPQQPGNKKYSDFARGFLIVAGSLALVVGFVAGTILLLDAYMNEAAKPPLSGKNERFTNDDELEKYSGAFMPDRDDEYFKRTYKDDTSTQRLELVGCDISDKGISYIKHLPLDFLDVRFCPRVTDLCLPMIGEIRTLEHLRLDNFTHKNTKGESSFTPLANLVRLRRLTVDGISLSQRDFEALSKIPNLESIHLNRMPDVTRENLLALRSMPKISDIELGGEHHPVDIYSALAQIKTLDTVGLTSSKVTDSDLSALVQMKQVKNLMLQRTFVSDKGMMFLAKNMPNLELINVTACPNVTKKGKESFEKAWPEVHVVVAEDFGKVKTTDGGAKSDEEQKSTEAPKSRELPKSNEEPKSRELPKSNEEQKSIEELSSNQETKSDQSSKPGQ